MTAVAQPDQPAGKPWCDKHGEMTRDGSLSWWVCEQCGRSLTDEDVDRLGGDPSKIVVT